MPVPHISGRRIGSRAQLEDFLKALEDVGATDHVFAGGGDPAVDAPLHAYIARKADETPYSQADLDTAKAKAAASATASERKRWTDWKATAPA